MAQIDDFQAAVTAAFDNLDVAHDGLAADVASLKDEIAKLVAASGQLPPETQAILASVQTRAEAISAKFTSLDALTTPPAPPAP